MKKILILLVTICICLTFSGCIKREKYVEDEYFNEWISPDGVHYWFREGLNGYSYLAPRYDHDGNLIIDCLEEE